MSTKSLLPTHKLQCFSVACLDMPRLEFGDKVVLPPNILLELQCVKVPNPFLFSVQATDVDLQLEGELDVCSSQYCSVQEFSAPDGQVFLPYWLMQNLGVSEGGAVVMTSVINLPRGIYCRFQPETMSFLDLAADIGPKLLMETTLRRYSVLSEDSTIVIEYRDTRYYVRVAELKPASVVSLCGDVDLETDFMPPDGFDPKRPSTGKFSIKPFTPDPSTANDESRVFSNNSSIPAPVYGRRLKDGGYVESTIITPTGNSTPVREQLSRKLHMNTIQRAQQSVRDKQKMTLRTESVAMIAEADSSSPVAAQLRSAQRAFSTPGYPLGSVIPVQPSKLDEEATLTIGQTIFRDTDRKCELCLANVSMTNMELHSLRCAKNTVYHKFECSICHEEVLRRHENQHQHCPHCSELYENIEALADHHRDEHTASFKCSPCGTVFTRSGLQNHLDNSHCDHVWMPCPLCGLSFKKKDLTQHSSMCSNRTDRCPFCKLYVKITEFDTHQEECTAFTQPEVAADSSDTTLSTSPRRKASSQNAVECAYCLQGGFSDIAAVERHVLHGCRIARSFAIDTVQDGKSNQEKAKAQSSGTDRDEIPRPLLAQGRMRRKGDFSALRGTPSQLRLTRLTNNNQLNHLIGRNSPVSLSPTVLPQARAELQAGKQRKPKPRPNPQLRALPKRTSMLIEDPEAKTSSVFAGLCISSAGGTSLAAPAQSRANTRVRGRHTGKGPSRLDKLL